jgi:hypothetical protein
MSLKRNETAIGFVEHAFGHDLDDAGQARRQSLCDDADALGFVGLLASLAADGVQPDAAVRDELVDTLGGDIRDALGEQAPDGDDVVALCDAYVAAKGERGVDLLARLVARVIYEVYGLQSHGFVQDDVLAALDVLAFTGAGQDARETARRVVRLSRRAARHTLGHLPEQLEFVHQLGRADGELPYAEIDRRLGGFAPRIYAQRLPSLTRSLIPEEARFRFVFVLWGRLRGVVLPRVGVQSIVEQIDPKRPLQLIERLETRADERAALRQAAAESPLAGRLEALFRERTIRA